MRNFVVLVIALLMVISCGDNIISDDGCLEVSFTLDNPLFPCRQGDQSTQEVADNYCRSVGVSFVRAKVFNCADGMGGGISWVVCTDCEE